MSSNFKHISIVVASLVLIGCGGGGSSTETPTAGTTVPTGNTDTPTTDNTTSDTTTDNTGSSGGTGDTSSTKEIIITDEYQVESLGKENSIRANIELGNTAKDLYILLSNYSPTESAPSTITHNKIVSVPQKKTLLATPLAKQPKILHAPAYIQEFNSNIKTLLQSNTTILERQSKDFAITTERQADVAGDSQTFYLDTGTTNTTAATAKKVVSDGTKTLNIWVSNDSFGTGCGKAKCVTQAMVDALADTFLKAGDDNDIYDWVTNIYGEEWGSAAQAKYSNFIGENDEITILLTDIDDDNRPTGGVIGYFWSKDNVENTSISGSNQRIMFYADAVMFANTDNDGFWQKEMVSTLAHEFQHMIHFYQKTVLLDASSDTWINEMLSETTEDLVATKIQHSGPRGVEHTDGSGGSAGNTNGRYPLFNENNTLSLTAWNNSLADYSKVNAFGTFLTRNYGGAKVLHDIMHNNLEHEDAIVDAVLKSPQGAGKTFDDLLKEWGVAVLLSDNNNLENAPEYNTGGFTPNTYNNNTYELGSINFFNYDPQPSIKTIAGTVESQGNYYYKVGENLTGTVTIDLTLNGTTEATLIAK